MIGREQRTATRFTVRVSTEYEGAQVGTGFTDNLSLSGVLIEYASASIPIKTEIGMRFSFFAGSFETVFRGIVIRQTEDGFAVQFVDMSEAQLEILRKVLRPYN